MSTPTVENSNDLRETESTSPHAGDVSDLDRLEAVLAQLERELWAPRLPPAAQLRRVPGLAPARRRFDDDDRSPLEPAHVVPPPAIVLGRERPRWPLGMLLAGFCAAPIAYYLVMGGWLPSAVPGSQLASVESKPVPPPAPPQERTPIRAQDDEAESPGANEISAPRAGAPPTPQPPEREIVAMVQPNDPGVWAASPQAVQVLGPEEIELLTKQGQQFADAGDFAAARTLFRRAAEANDATAATALGATYDPIVLAGLRAMGIDPDAVKARFWYQKAVSLGSSDAKRRLELLADHATK